MPYYDFKVDVIVSPQQLFKRNELFKTKAKELMNKAITSSIKQLRQVYERNTTGGIINSKVLSKALVVNRGVPIPETFFKVRTERFGIEARIEPKKKKELYLSIAHQWEFGKTRDGSSVIRARKKKYMTLPNIGAPGVKRTSDRPAGPRGRWSPRLRFARVRGKPVLIQDKQGNAKGLSTSERIKFWLRSEVRVRKATSFWQRTLQEIIDSGTIEKKLQEELSKSFKVKRRS